MSNLRLEQDDLVINPTARVPICLCLDVSGSMAGDPIKELNEGLRLFFEAIRADEIAQWSAEVVVVAFGSSVVKLMDFGPIQRQPFPRLTPFGETRMAAGVQEALNLLEARKKEYSEKGVDYYQPWLVLMTDGKPTDTAEELQTAIERTARLARERKLSVFAIGIGKEADLKVVEKFSPMRSPLRLKGLKFKEFFEWLSRSVQAVSNSTPGQNVELDVERIKEWSSI